MLLTQKDNWHGTEKNLEVDSSTYQEARSFYTGFVQRVFRCETASANGDQNRSRVLHFVTKKLFP